MASSFLRQTWELLRHGPVRNFFRSDLLHSLSREGKFRTALCEATNIQTDLLLDLIVFFIIFLLD